MNCTNCGAVLSEGSGFCASCGTPVQAAPQQAPQQPVYQQPVYQQPIYQQPIYQQRPATPGNGLAVTSMVLGIISLVLFCLWYICLPCAIIAVALGGVAASKAKAVGMKNGIATAGITCSCIALGLMLLILIAGASFLNSVFGLAF